MMRGSCIRPRSNEEIIKGKHLNRADTTVPTSHTFTYAILLTIKSIVYILVCD